MKKLLPLLSLIMLSGVTALAQNGTPDPGEVELYSSLDLSIHSVMNVLGGVFYHYVRGPLDKAAVALFVVTLAQAGLQSFTRYSIINLEWLVERFYLPYGFARYVMDHWTVSIPGLGHTFPGLFTDAAQELAAYVNTSALDTLSSLCHDIQKALGVSPSIMDAGFTTYWVTVGGIISFQTVAFYITSVAFIALAVGGVWGLVAVAFYPFPPMRWLYQSWLRYMVKYSSYLVVAPVVTNIMALFIVLWIQRSLHGDYSLEHFAAMSFEVPVVFFGSVIALLRIPQLANDLTSGGASAGAGMGGYLGGLFR
jgi:TrbL/VirB6 plasmid conjugal transfer protein